MTELKAGETISSRHLFTPLEGQSFTYREMQEAVLAHFNEHTGDIPPGYKWTHLVEWGQEHHWIQRVTFGEYRIEIPTPKAEVIDSKKAAE